MAEPHRKSSPFRIHISYSFDRLLEPKLAQVYDILVPCRERPVGVRVKEFDDEDGSNLRQSFVRATTPPGCTPCEVNLLTQQSRLPRCRDCVTLRGPEFV